MRTLRQKDGEREKETKTVDTGNKQKTVADG